MLESRDPANRFKGEKFISRCRKDISISHKDFNKHTMENILQTIMVHVTFSAIVKAEKQSHHKIENTLLKCASAYIFSISKGWATSTLSTHLFYSFAAPIYLYSLAPHQYSNTLSIVKGKRQEKYNHICICLLGETPHITINQTLMRNLDCVDHHF